jgi:hypothetical protein
MLAVVEARDEEHPLVREVGLDLRLMRTVRARVASKMGRLSASDCNFVRKAFAEEFLLEAPTAEHPIDVNALQKIALIIREREKSHPQEVTVLMSLLSEVRGLVVSLIGDVEEVAVKGDMYRSGEIRKRAQSAHQFNLVLSVIRGFLQNHLPSGFRWEVREDSISIWAPYPDSSWPVLTAWLISFLKWCKADDVILQTACGPIVYDFGCHVGPAFRPDPGSSKDYVDTMYVASRLLASAKKKSAGEGLIVISEKLQSLSRNMRLKITRLSDYYDRRHKESYKRWRLWWQEATAGGTGHGKASP